MTTQTLEQELKERDQLYKPSAKRAEIVDVPAMNFLKVDGLGDPNTSQGYREAIEALNALSYTLKFGIKQTAGVNYRVAPLEGLWWSEQMDAFLTANKEAWNWTMMVAQPSVVTQEWVERAFQEVQRKKDPPALYRVRFESFHEGLCAQILYIGPYADEGPTIQRLHEFIHAQGGVFEGSGHKHHEIYLGDPRRAAPEKLKTVIRQPFMRAG